MSNVAAPAQPDLIDLRFLPAWVKQDTPQYADFEGEEMPAPDSRGARERPRREERRRERRRDERRDQGQRDRRGQAEPRRESRGTRPSSPRPRPAVAAPVLPKLDIRFLPHGAAFENVAAQIKSGTAAYSLYALSRLFLQKPERYDVLVTAKAEEKSFFRLSESGEISSDRVALETSAFRALRNDYYDAEVTLNEPVKGNFTSVARERSSGLLLGPTNHHAYQPQLRRLFEQRFSRRMSFADFQRQIEIVNDPALVEQWKEEARKVTKFTARKEEPPLTFTSEGEAERHFREKYLPGLVVETREAEIDGRTSRQLRDRLFGGVIEDAWSAEERSPSKMMQELAGRLRGAGLHIFRHRKGMLFVSPVRPKAIDESAVSDSVGKILETVKASPRINRKDLAHKLIPAGEASDEAKMKLASDLHWLVREGHVIEFNDGSLDLPRIKAPMETAPQANLVTETPVATQSGTMAAVALSESEASSAAEITTTTAPVILKDMSAVGLPEAVIEESRGETSA